MSTGYRHTAAPLISPRTGIQVILYIFSFDSMHARTYREHEFCLNEYGSKSHGGKMLRMKVGLIHTVRILFQVFCLLDNSFIPVTSYA